MNGILKGLQGRFILSLNDTPEVRKIFKGFKIDVVKTTYFVSGSPKQVGELLISN